MNWNPPRDTSVRLVTATGERYTYSSLAQAIRTLGLTFFRKNIGRVFVEFQYADVVYAGDRIVARAPVYHVSPYILQDAAGQVLSYDDVQSCYCREVVRRVAFDPVPYGAPVPRSGRSRYRSLYSRRARGQRSRIQSGVMRELAGEYPELEPLRAKAKRRASAWDDTWRSDSRDCNWKRFRRTQWR